MRAPFLDRRFSEYNVRYYNYIPLSMVNAMIHTFGTEDQKNKYCPLLTNMDMLASYCLTEPGSGSDASALVTTARREGMICWKVARRKGMICWKIAKCENVIFL